MLEMAQTRLTWCGHSDRPCAACPQRILETHVHPLDHPVSDVSQSLKQSTETLINSNAKRKEIIL